MFMTSHEDYLRWVLETTNQEYEGDIKAFSKMLTEAYEH